jgi:hypothetical protein
MNTVAILGVVGVWTGVFVAFWRWQSRRTRVGAKRQKAMLLGIHWLVTRAEQKPDEYVSTTIKDALKEDE